MSGELEEAVLRRGRAEGILEPSDSRYAMSGKARELAQANLTRFEVMRNNYVESLQRKAIQLFPGLGAGQARTLATDIESSLSDYFRQDGLLLATSLFASGRPNAKPALPPSLARFINTMSTRYDSLELRQAFSATCLGSFVRPTSAERNYLGRVAQGFFAFHALARIIHEAWLTSLLSDRIELFVSRGGADEMSLGFPALTLGDFGTAMSA